MTEQTPNGILLLSKPAGVTSHDMVNRIRKLYHTKQVGHTGTLDPMATGLLTILIGRAVKASEYAMAAKKRYVATLKLGITSDTEDVTGQILTRADSLPHAAEVLAVMPRFTGEILQTPPMVSAIKVGGERLMDLARRGVEIEREARPITIYALSCEVLDEAAGEYRLDVTCSKGTYIRTLCADIGRALCCGGVMASLCRTENGCHTLAEAFTPEQLEQMDEEARLALLHPTEQVFSDYPELILPAFYARLAYTGNPIYLHKLPKSALPCEMLGAGDYLRLLDAQGFFALARVISTEEGLAAKSVKLLRL